MIETRASCESIIGQIASRYSVPSAQVERDVGELLERLLQEKLVEINRPERSPRHDAGERFGDRYAIHALQDGGVVIDLVTGTYARLNPGATLLCHALIGAEDPSEAKATMSHENGV